MVYSLGYRRPHSVKSSKSSDISISGAVKQKSINDSISSSKGSYMPNGIPEALSFDRIVSGGTCPPCTTRDFMNYLEYVEHSAENLQFYLWFKDYCKRFEALPEREKALSREWTVDESDTHATYCQTQTLRIQKQMSKETAAFFENTDFASTANADIDHEIDPFHTPPRTPPRTSTQSEDSLSSSHSTLAQSDAEYTSQAAAVFSSANTLQPFTIQPYRAELARIITLYIATTAPRQLNLSAREREGLLLALSKTTHPSAFAPVLTSVEWALRCQAHPNFIRWTICNGNRPRVLFARGLGATCVVAGLCVALALTLSSRPRAYRVLALLPLLLGASTLVAACKGMCVLLHGMQQRHVRPWELFAAAAVEKEGGAAAGLAQRASSWEDEPWVARYRRRNIVRKVFDRQVWIEEPALRGIQDTVVVQSMLAGLLVGGVVTGVFCAVPGGALY